MNISTKSKLISSKADAALYILTALMSVMSLSLIFNDNVWFDEAYTLALIRHSYGEIIDIIKTDMHPPLYFISLKAFSSVFGYSIVATKLFSAIGFVVTLLLAPTVVKRMFDSRTAIVYLLIIGAVPYSFYFCAQQRSYTYCILFVTLCFLLGIQLIRQPRYSTAAALGLCALLAAYNHTYALISAALVFAYINIYMLIKNRRHFAKILLADSIAVVGYIGWLFVLISQTKDAADNYWLKSVDILGVIIFAASAVLFGLMMIIKRNRKTEIILGLTAVLGIQAVGLGISVVLRPLYIAQYSVVTLGIFAVLTAMLISESKPRIKSVLCILLIVGTLFNFTAAAAFEYNGSLKDFRSEFDTVYTDDDTFIYCDTSFGIMTYYYPNATHICTYRQKWFDAFSNLQYEPSDKLKNYRNDNGSTWLVINKQKQLPKWLSQSHKLTLYSEFRSDFNHFDVYLIS